MQGDKKMFKIIMIDDTPGALSSGLDDIAEYLEERYELKLELVRYEEPSEIIGNIDQTTDIVFVDKGLNGASGIDVVKDIRQQDKLMDIFIYSQDKISDKDLAELSDYGMIVAARKKAQIVDGLKTLIDKNLSKWEDIVYLRGTVISKLIDLERDIDDVLMEVFLPCGKERQEKFRNYLLENSNVSMYAKQTILSKIAEPENGKSFSINELNTLQKCRNLLAHCKRSKDNPNVLVKMGEDRKIGRDEIKAIFKKAEHLSECLMSFRQAQISSRSPTST